MDGRIIGGFAFGVGGLAHLLRNRFYIGEVVYRGETFRGGHEPILDPALFAAVQAKLASQAVERRCRIRGLPALLTGRLFDEQGQRMTPTHTNKEGVRYSYYVSQAVLRRQPPGMIGRVAAPELEALVVDAVRHHLQANSTAPDPILETDRELIERHLRRAMLSMRAITLHLRQEIADSEASGDVPAAGSLAAAPTKVTIPWTGPAAVPVKGIVHVPAHNTPMKPGGRETLLIAISQGAQMGQGRRAWPEFRRHCRPRRKSRTPHPPSRAARFRVAAHHHCDYRWHRTGRDHHDGAHGRAVPYLGRAGTDDKRARTGPSTPWMSGAPDAVAAPTVNRKRSMLSRRNERPAQTPQLITAG